MTAVAQTDHGSMAGTYAFIKACRKEGIKPIAGIEAYLAVDATVKTPDDYGKSYYHIVLLAMNNEGLKNLYKLTTYSYVEGMYKRPRIDMGTLRAYSEGLIVTSACIAGLLPSHIRGGRPDMALAHLLEMKEIFGDRYYLEVQAHNMEEQTLVNTALISLAQETETELVLTNDVHYLKDSHKLYHELTLAISTNTLFSNPKRMSYAGLEVYLKSPDEMHEKLESFGLPESAYTNTAIIANRIDSDSYMSDRKNRFPTFHKLPEGVTSSEYLKQLCEQALADNKIIPEEKKPQYDAQLSHELKVIKKVGFSDYMLIVAYIVQQSEAMGVLTGPGRGSAAGSLVSYLMGITKVDPIRYGLLFERFLNPGRSGAPLIFDEITKTKLHTFRDHNEDGFFKPEIPEVAVNVSLPVELASQNRMGETLEYLIRRRYRSN